MPELPEVEVTRRGIAPHVEGHAVTGIVTRTAGLRWPFPPDLPAKVCGQTVRRVGRRGKYLLLEFDHGTLIVHLGMSGHLHLLPVSTPPRKHDHFDMLMGETLLRLNDPRRFGAVLWHPKSSETKQDEHTLLGSLGIEPFDPAFDGRFLYDHTRRRKAAIKQVLLSGRIVVGVGNIYASESLFHAGIHPETPAERIGVARYERLAQAVRGVLSTAIERGGSTLRDFSAPDGQRGYFQDERFVYDRAGEPCRACRCVIRHIRQGQRSTFFCEKCQK
jgi:formamidopyrimidine-DNA glycosylase